MEISLMGQGMPTSARKARALFAFSTTKSFRPRIVSSACADRASFAAPPSGVGMA